jgi:Dimerisation domain
VDDGNMATVAERLRWTSDALHAAATVSAAHRLGLLTALEAGRVRAEDVASDCNLDVHGTTVLLMALAAMGLVDSSADGRFEPAVPKLSLLGAIGASAELLVEAVRTGRAPLECDIPARSHPVLPETVTSLGTLMRPAAEAVAEYLSGADQMLDVAAGAAPWSLVLARREPALPHHRVGLLLQSLL